MFNLLTSKLRSLVFSAAYEAFKVYEAERRAETMARMNEARLAKRKKAKGAGALDEPLFASTIPTQTFNIGAVPRTRPIHEVARPTGCANEESETYQLHKQVRGIK